MTPPPFVQPLGGGGGTRLCQLILVWTKDEKKIQDVRGFHGFSFVALRCPFQRAQLFAWPPQASGAQCALPPHGLFLCIHLQ